MNKNAKVHCTRYMFVKLRNSPIATLKKKIVHFFQICNTIKTKRVETIDVFDADVQELHIG